MEISGGLAVCTGLILALMLSIGCFPFHQLALGITYFAGAGLSGLVLRKLMSQIKFL